MESQLAIGQLRPFEYLLQASLYVGDLHPTVTEMDLGQVFGRIGPILSLRLCRDRVSGESLCYGYVNFYSPPYAYAAIACLNHTWLKGKPMRIMWSERDPRKRKTGDGNLFVKNLAPSITSPFLEKIFCKYGTILSCKVVEDGGFSKGFGFVQYDSIESSIAARDALHDTILEGKKLYVSKFVKKNERRYAPEEPKFTNLYVKSLGGNLTHIFLREMFSKFGKLRYVRIIKDAVGFVNFESHCDAKAAMNALNGSQFGSGKLFVNKAKIKAGWKNLMTSGQNEIIKYNNERSYDSNLYVKNLHRLISDKDLKEHFSSFGKVTSAKVMRYDNGGSKGFGFVNFSTPEEANKAWAAFHGSVLLGKTLYVAKAEPYEERQRKLQSYYAFTSQVHPTFSFLPAFPIYNTASYINSQKSVMYQHSGFTYIVHQSQQQKGHYTTADNQYVRLKTNY